jgi:acylphosphatase
MQHWTSGICTFWAVLAAVTAGSLISCGKGGSTPSGVPVAVPVPEIIVDRVAHAVSVQAAVAEQNIYSELKGMIEFALVGKGGKEYETVLVTAVDPPKIYDALRQIGLHGGRAATDTDPPRGQPVLIFVEWTDQGKKNRRPLEDFIFHVPTDKTMDPMPWIFTGSAETLDPATNQKSREAYLSRTLIGLHPTDRTPFFQNPRMESRTGNIYQSNAALLPAKDTPVWVVFQRVLPPVAPAVRRVHALVGGRLIGTGFGTFVARQGRLLDLSGFVRDLPDGQVEALAEGPTDRVEQLLEALRLGPKQARVEKVRVDEEPAEGDLDRFDLEE